MVALTHRALLLQLLALASSPAVASESPQANPRWQHEGESALHRLAQVPPHEGHVPPPATTHEEGPVSGHHVAPEEAPEEVQGHTRVEAEEGEAHAAAEPEEGEGLTAEVAETDTAEGHGLGSEGEEEAGLEEEHGEEHEEEFSGVDIGVAMTLLGSVALVMTLFHLVNFKDDDIRRYSWGMISSTVSIFTAVLVYHGIHDLVNLASDMAMKHPLLVNSGLFLALFVIMQVGIAFIAGAHCESEKVDLSHQCWTVADLMRSDYGEKVRASDVRNISGVRSVAIINGLEVYVRKSTFEKETRQRRMKGWALLLAHITGFAAISLGDQLQHLPAISHSWVLVAGTVLATQAGLLLLFEFAKTCRDILNDASSHEQDERDEMFMEEVEEAENDVSSIAVSFLTVQTLRHALTGVLPDLEGLKDGEHAHESRTVLCLLLIGMGMAVGSVLLTFTMRQERHTFARRLLEVLQSQLAMSFAWCVLSAARWQALNTHVFDPLGGVQSVSARIILAVCMSALAVLAIFGLDSVEDIQKNSKVTDGRQLLKVITCLTNALGILVGFSWEFCFDGGVAAVASLTHRPVTTKLLMAVVVMVVIIPMWRRHILSKVLFHKQMRLETILASRLSLHDINDGVQERHQGRRGSDPSIRAAALQQRPRHMSGAGTSPTKAGVNGSYCEVPAGEGSQ